MESAPAEAGGGAYSSLGTPAIVGDSDLGDFVNDRVIARCTKQCREIFRLAKIGENLCPRHPLSRRVHLAWRRIQRYVHNLGYPNFRNTGPAILRLPGCTVLIAHMRLASIGFIDRKENSLEYRSILFRVSTVRGS
jgi:hypothetical protein